MDVDKGDSEGKAFKRRLDKEPASGIDVGRERKLRHEADLLQLRLDEAAGVNKKWLYLHMLAAIFFDLKRIKSNLNNGLHITNIYILIKKLHICFLQESLKIIYSKTKKLMLD